MDLIGILAGTLKRSVPIIQTIRKWYFRGWYDFGGGSMADMGHYSLWTVFNALNTDRHRQL
jgi:hypothetical protein